MAEQHSPLPWGWDGHNVTGLDGGVIPVEGIAQPHGWPPDAQGIANAEFIVRACNSHEALVEALRAIVSAYDSSPSPLSRITTKISQAREALKIAEIPNAQAPDA